MYRKSIKRMVTVLTATCMILGGSMTAFACEHEVEAPTPTGIVVEGQVQAFDVCGHDGSIEERLLDGTPAAENAKFKYFNATAAQDVSMASPNATVIVESGEWKCLTKRVLRAVENRGDVTLVVRFKEDGKVCQYVIPAGSKFEGLDCVGFAYLENRFGKVVK